MLEKGDVESITIGNPEKPEIILGLKERDLFDISTKMDKDSVELSCEIFNFNKFENNGKLVVPDEQPIKMGDYSFSIIGDQDNVQYINSMLKPKVNIRCLKETKLDPFGEEAICKLHIIEVTQDGI